jgi:hypothetical protein
MDNVLEIVKKHLEDNGYDGLYHDNDCGCTLDDLGACSCFCLECTPGYKQPVPPGHPDIDVDFIIGPKP